MIKPRNITNLILKMYKFNGGMCLMYGLIALSCINHSNHIVRIIILNQRLNNLIPTILLNLPLGTALKTQLLILKADLQQQLQQNKHKIPSKEQPNQQSKPTLINPPTQYNLPFGQHVDSTAEVFVDFAQFQEFADGLGRVLLEDFGGDADAVED
jgi:hypothetical protein